MIQVLTINNIWGQQKDEYWPNIELVKTSIKKGESLGYKPLPMCVGKNEGRIVFFPNMTMYIAKADLDPNFPKLEENLMVINVGDLSLTVHKVKLSKGEYAVFKKGKFIKQTDKISIK
jgi:hypothetical protein